MDIQSIRKIIFPAVSNAVSKLEEENHKIKITMLREIFNEAINGALNISHSNNTSIKAMFSGRGRAWAKINVDNNIKFTFCSSPFFSIFFETQNGKNGLNHLIVGQSPN